MRLSDLLLTALAATALVACGSDDSDSEGSSPSDAPETPNAEGQQNTKLGDKQDAWDAANNPERMARFLERDLDYTYDNLPKNGTVNKISWPATYWPTYADSTNYRWRATDGEVPTIDQLSPLEKYDVAFNNWEITPEFLKLKPFNGSNCGAVWDEDYYREIGPAARWMSENKGNKRSRDGVDSDDDGEIDECDSESNDGVEFWWGLCHAWVPASMNEPEPQYPVTHNGVTFYPADIKALLMTIYDRSRSIIIGGRCNAKEVERDEQGRIKDPKCRDTNAGSFHVLMTNFIGRYGMAIAEDRTYNYEVWNQPIHDYKVEHAEEIDEAKAVQLLNLADGTSYPFNEDTKRWIDVRMTVRYVTESHAEERPLSTEIERYLRTDRYHYILELGLLGKVLGGEWVQDLSQQPDFLWVSTGPSEQNRGRNPHVEYPLIKDLLEKAQRPPEDPDAPNPTNRVEFTNDTVVEIPDNDDAGATSTITVESDKLANRFFMRLNISHTYVGDLKIRLVGQDLDKTLRDKEGGSANDIDATYEITELQGKSPAGTYKLVVTDHADRDVGTLNHWTITVETD